MEEQYGVWSGRDKNKESVIKMCNRNATFIVFALFLTLFCDTTSSECIQQAPCICTLPDGHYYNLTSVANELPFEDTQNNFTVYFHPCTNVKIKTEYNYTCANDSKISVCMFNKRNNLTQSLGTIEETKMKLSEFNGNKFPIFEIRHNNITTVINIVCSPPGSKTNFQIEAPIPSSGSKEYHFMLISPHGCIREPHKGLSTGSILLILFFTVAGIYFIGGIITLKILRGATGWEMLPNHDFWSKLPLLVRDGIVFTFNCCRADSYERI